MPPSGPRPDDTHAGRHHHLRVTDGDLDPRRLWSDPPGHCLRRRDVVSTQLWQFFETPVRVEEAGLPRGVLSVVTSSSSSDVSKPIISDPRLRKLTFTGSTEVGRKLIAQSADQVLKVSMELGGNAPFLVFADADVDAAVEGAMIAKMRNIGEACTAANRFHVAGRLADEFTQKLAAKMGAMKVGRGVDDGRIRAPRERYELGRAVANVWEARVLQGSSRGWPPWHTDHVRPPWPVVEDDRRRSPGCGAAHTGLHSRESDGRPDVIRCCAR